MEFLARISQARKSLNPGLYKSEPDSLSRREKAKSSSTDYFPPDSSKARLDIM